MEISLIDSELLAYAQADGAVMDAVTACNSAASYGDGTAMLSAQHDLGAALESAGAPAGAITGMVSSAIDNATQMNAMVGGSTSFVEMIGQKGAELAQGMLV